MSPSSRFSTVAAGIACGIGASVFWAAGFTAARHGLDVGFSPADLVAHRFLWAGLAFLPYVFHSGVGDLNGIGWGRGILLTLLGGPGFACMSYAGFLFVPLAHGGLIQPACATLGGLLLATVLLKEKLAATRAIGALIIVCGLAVIGGEALTTIGSHGVAGDLMFMTAGLMFATFGALLRLWGIAAMPAAAVVSVLALAALPGYWAFGGFEHMIARGWRENLLQVVMQGLVAGPGALYLYIRSVIVLGAGRAAVFPSLVPPFVLVIGWLVLGEVPSMLQLIGLVIVLFGFQLAQRR